MAARKITSVAYTVFLLNNATTEETSLSFKQDKESRLELGTRVTMSAGTEDRWDGQRVRERPGEAWMRRGKGREGEGVECVCKLSQRIVFLMSRVEWDGKGWNVFLG